MRYSILKGRLVREARLLELAPAVDVGCTLALVDCMNSRISEHRPTQLVPGAFVIESPKRNVRPA